ncbi:MAG: hypothetical protein IT305_12895 [Chloroflexi bacterium]|nr:hypothetical protein [Chloroflexota bacterium]
MSQSVVVKSFADLPRLLDLDDLPPGPVDIATEQPPEAISLDSAPEPAGEAGATLDLADLLAELEAASATLAAVARQDEETRTLAIRDLERYDTVAAALEQAEQVHKRAGELRERAERLTAEAFATEARTAAERVASIAARSAAAAGRLAEDRRAELERLATELDLERVLAERRRQEEAERARAAEAERARRLSGALAEASEALQSGRIEEAKALAGYVCSESPDNADAASLLTMIAQREMTVKTIAADEALWAVRRDLRRDPAEAVARLETLDVDGLPSSLAAQVFGEWARAGSRLCRERSIAEPLRYAPDPGRGAIVAHDAGRGEYVVVSALGMGPGWKVGTVVGERQVRRARPLR